MTFFLLNVLLALAWMALTGVFNPGNFFVGFVLGYLTLRMTQKHRPSPYFRKVGQVIRFALFFAWEVVKANLRVAIDVLTPRPRMTPGIVAIPLEAGTDAEITMLANLITLTPGTLSLDVSSDRRVLYIHAMYIGDVEEFKKSIKEGLERRLLEVLR
jgi:multicomponent Na+:H+ antiporter subunit E